MNLRMRTADVSLRVIRFEEAGVMHSDEGLLHHNTPAAEIRGLSLKSYRSC